MNDTPADVTVTLIPLYDGGISPWIYGDFVEFLNDLIPGMWAEKIEDRSFEGMSQPVHTWPPGASTARPRWQPWSSLRPGPAGPVTASGPNLQGMPDAASFETDTRDPYAGARCARVTVGVGDGRPCLAGIAQGGIALKAGERLRFRMRLRTGARDLGAVTVRLGRDYGVFARVYDEVELRPAGSGEWELLEGELTSPTTDDDATLSIGAGRPGSFWIDQVSLMPEANVRGWRPDVVQALRDLRPGMIRFGGSSLIFYDWERGLLPRERRAAFLNEPWGNMESGDVGLFEFLELCEEVGAEPLVCTNSNSSTTESILNEIEFCNGPRESCFGRIRASLGHPEPFDVRYWQIGNEQAGEEYERRLVADAKAIKARYPGLVLMASYPSESIISGLSDVLDYVCPHLYDPVDARAEAGYRDLIATIQRTAKNRDLRLGFTEWNITGGAWGTGRAWLQSQYCALNAALTLQMYQRLGDTVRIACRSNLTNSCCSGIIQTSKNAFYLTPTYYAQRAFASMAGEVALRVRPGGEDPLGYSATLHEPDGELALFVVNMQAEAQTRRIGFAVGTSPGAAARQARVWTLAAESLDAVNSFVEPQHVAPVESVLAIRPGEIVYSFAPFSLTVLRVHAAPPFSPSGAEVSP